ncbi:unnamed protein product [Paramecium pentaurelia]|uniref:EF-hand domain-containing protein n=1 Tax=Paramecium pentaurelia TaxID=43138 RepID=A0A8S1SLL0_9CILI|nr:unnamed protein product [Paramecium pentaurelia]
MKSLSKMEEMFLGQSTSQSPTKTFQKPRKYDKLIHKTTQIPRISIQRLVECMDQDNDGWIKKEDILKFSQKHYLFFEEELAQAMIDEALSKRIVAFKDQLKEPINVDEILGAVQIHYVLNENHVWIEKPRPFRDKWVQLLLAAGEKLPTGHDLPPVKITKILDMHEMNPFQYKPKLNCSQSQIIHTSQLKEIHKFNKDKPEAGIILQETDLIKPINNGIIKQEEKDNPFEKVINSKFYIKDQNEFPTIKFETQSYFNEAERLSKEQKLCRTGRNPILKFMPENLNYKVENSDSQRKSNEFQLNQTTAAKYLSQPVLLRKPYYGLSDTALINSEQKYFQPKKSIDNNNNECDKQIFYATFKPEDVMTLKNKLANLKQREKEKLEDFYNPPSTHKFRDEYLDKNKPLFKTRIKPDSLPNPHLMSEHDQRPQFAIEEDLKKQLKEEQKQQQLIDDYMGTFKQSKQWTKYFPTTDLNHNFVDHKRPNFLDKGNYQEPGLIMLQFLREGASAKDNFQLFHRLLRTNDKHLFLGQQVDPN